MWSHAQDDSVSNALTMFPTLADVINLDSEEDDSEPDAAGGRVTTDVCHCVVN